MRKASKRTEGKGKAIAERLNEKGRDDDGLRAKINRTN